MKIGNKIFKDYTYIMAIINLTPDSFWAESRKNADNVMFAVEKAVRDGASVIDLGPQSTRPGHTQISADEEIERFARPLELIKSNFDIPVSVDTYYEKSAEQALMLGADMINDVWGLSYDGGMAQVIARYGASVCIMHNSKSPLTGDIWGAINSFLTSAVDKALEYGIEKDRIVLDGGIGFAKNREQNFELLNGYERLLPAGYPLLLGASRKSMFGGNVEDRLPQTLESTRIAAGKGVLFVRVHDVKENKEVIDEVYGRNQNKRS